MQVSHMVSAVFDDPNLIGHAGLVPVLQLAQRAGLHDLVGAHLSVPSPNLQTAVRRKPGFPCPLGMSFARFNRDPLSRATLVRDRPIVVPLQKRLGFWCAAIRNKPDEARKRIASFLRGMTSFEIHRKEDWERSLKALSRVSRSPETERSAVRVPACPFFSTEETP